MFYSNFEFTISYFLMLIWVSNKSPKQDGLMLSLPSLYSWQFLLLSYTPISLSLANYIYVIVWVPVLPTPTPPEKIHFNGALKFPKTHFIQQ